MGSDRKKLTAASSRLYAKQASAEDLAAFGLTPGDVGPDLLELTPEEFRSVALFLDLQTQWRMGPGGVIGLDYNVLPLVLELRAWPRDERERVFDDVRVMERAALQEMIDG